MGEACGAALVIRACETLRLVREGSKRRNEPLLPTKGDEHAGVIAPYFGRAGGPVCRIPYTYFREHLPGSS